MKYTLLLILMICGSILNIFTESTQHMDEFNSVSDIEAFAQINPDSALLVLHKWYVLGKQKNDTVLAIKSLLSMSNIQAKRLNHGEAFDHSGEALFLSDEFRDTLLMAEAYSSFGRLNYMFNQKVASGTYLNRACNLYKMMLKQRKIQAEKLLSAYFGLTLYHRWYSNFETALVYLDSCYMISDTINHGMVNRAYLDAEKGQILLLQEHPEAAIELLIPTSLVFEDLVSTAENPSDDKGFLVLLYSVLGDAYRMLKEVDLAMFFYEKSIKAGDEFNTYPGQKPHVLERYAWMLFEQGWYVEAYNNLKEAKALNDRYFSARSFQNSDFITVKNSYREELIRKNRELNQKSMSLIEIKKSVLWLRILFYTSASLLLLWIILVLYRVRKTRFIKKENVIQKKEEQSRELLEKKNKALTSSTLMLIEKEAIILRLSKQMLRGGSEKEKQALLKSVKQDSRNIWINFNKQFMDVNIGFYERLQIKIPGLSLADQKICALIKLNFSGKEMAHLLGISLGSVHMARHRLRKKMHMARDKSLSAFISSI